MPQSKWPLLDEIYGKVKVPEIAGPRYLDTAPVPQKKKKIVGNPINEFVNKVFGTQDRNRLREARLEDF